MGLLSKILRWLGGSSKPQGEPALEPQDESAEDVDSAEEETSSDVVFYDENLFERARTQWQFGDWESLADIERESLNHHPQRARLALLVASGHQQLGDMDATREFSNLAQQWGCSKKQVSQVLIAGVYNTLGKAASLTGNEQRALGHFEQSVRTGGDGGDVRLLAQARGQRQICKVGQGKDLNKMSSVLPVPEHKTFPKRPQNLLRYAKGYKDIPLCQNTAHQFAAKHALCHYPSGAVYSFIPKNGCTSFRYSLAIANKCISGPDDFEWIHKNNDTFRAGLHELVNAPYTFVILRCPYTRLASLYLDKVVNQRDVVPSLNEINVNNIDLSELSFRLFVDLLCNDKALEKNHHWKPQVDFLVYQDYSDWFCMEDFTLAIHAVREKIGLEIYDTRGLAKHGTDQYSLICGNYIDTPAKEILSLQNEGCSPSHASLYDNELLSKVSALYSEDIKLYEDRFGVDSLAKNSKVLFELNS